MEMLCLFFFLIRKMARNKNACVTDSLHAGNGKKGNSKINQRPVDSEKISIFRLRWKNALLVYSSDISAWFHVNLMSKNYVFQSNSFRNDTNMWCERTVEANETEKKEAKFRDE